jgi:hypothetical protein
MSVKRTPKGNPDLTAYEIHKHLPDITYAAVTCAITSLQKKGAVESRGKRMIMREGGKNPHPCNTYHVKYKTQAKAEPKRKLKTQVKPVVKQVQVAAPNQTERNIETIARILENMNSSYRTVADNNEKLIALLTDTLDDLAETKRALHEAQMMHRGWWAKTKEWFA